jgi:hypothetical protein
VPDAVFIPLGDERFAATELAAGPWDPQSQHGGAPAALIARAVEQSPESAGMQIARLSYELLKPVPVGEVEVALSVLRPGRRVKLLGASLLAAGTEVTRASVLLIRSAPGEVPAATAPDEPPPLPAQPAEGAGWRPPGVTFADAHDLAFAAGRFDHSGPATAWFRLRVPLVRGEETSPLQRLAAAADFGNGISSELPWTEYVFINPDLTVYVDRPPAGEWICLDSRSFVHDAGTGTSESILYDQTGRVGRAVQSLYVARREAPLTSA